MVIPAYCISVVSKSETGISFRTFSVSSSVPLYIFVKADNIQLIRKLNRLSDQETDICVKAERQFLKQIGGSCHLPVGAYCKIQDEKLILRAMFGTEDGKKLAYTKVESAVLNKIEDSSQIDEICRQIAREAVEKIQIQLSHEE